MLDEEIKRRSAIQKEAFRMQTSAMFSSLKHNIRLFEVMLILIIILLGFAGFILSKNYFDNQFKARTEDLIKNTAINLTGLEKEMENALNNALIATQEGFVSNPKFSQQNLSALSNKMGIKTISILNGSDGRFYLTSEKLFSKEDKYYKDFSVTDLNQCATQMCGGKLCRNPQQIENCRAKRQTVLNAIKNPNQIFFLPFYNVKIYTNVQKETPAKWAISYNKQTDKIFDLFYSGEDITNILEDTLNAHSKFINQIILSDNKGNLIANTKSKAIKGEIQIELPFGKKWFFDVNGDILEYSYILKMTFDTSELKTQILILKIMFTMIVFLTIILVILFRLKFFTKEEIMEIVLKCTQKEKP